LGPKHELFSLPDVILWHGRQQLEQIVSTLMTTTEVKSNPDYNTDAQFLGQMVSQAAHTYKQKLEIGQLNSQQDMITYVACHLISNELTFSAFGMSLSGWNIRLCKAETTAQYFIDLAKCKKPSEIFKVCLLSRSR
jgi:hypothetical protein